MLLNSISLRDRICFLILYRSEAEYASKFYIAQRQNMLLNSISLRDRICFLILYRSEADFLYTLIAITEDSQCHQKDKADS